MSDSRGLAQSMLLVGGAKSASIVISIIRIKLLALMLGPAGLGLLGILNSVLGLSTKVAGLGLSSSGVREIAAVRGEAATLGRVRTVLFAAHVIQGLIALAAIWLVSDTLAEWLFGDPTRAFDITLVGVAVLFTLVASSQTTLLQGMRRIRHLGLVTVLGTLTATVAGLFAVCLGGYDGLVWFVVVQPIAAVLVAFAFTRKLPRVDMPRMRGPELWETWRPMAAVGVVFMFSGLLTTGTLLFVRARIIQTLGLDAAGQFAASWGITMQYVGFLLTAMIADFYPRLSEVINDAKVASRLINDQLQLGAAIGGPILVGLVGAAPWMMSAMYSSEFEVAAGLLQWQTVGNVFKLASWPLGCAFVAAARAKTVLLVESTWNGLYLAMLWFGLPLVGLDIAGVAFLLAYILYFAVLVFLSARLLGFRWNSLSVLLIVVNISLSICVFAIARYWDVAGLVVGTLFAMCQCVFGLRIVLTKIGEDAKGAAIFRQCFEAVGWPVEVSYDK